jgi:hypothetical protein
MRRFACICVVAAVLGCADRGSPPATTADSAQMAAPAAAGINLADLAGTWNFTTMPEDRDTVLVTYQLVATADQNGWQILLPNRPPVPAQVLAAEGDSIVLHAGPFESVLRPGQQVTTHTVLRMQGDRLVGTLKAMYQVTTADSVAMLRTEGTRGM